MFGKNCSWEGWRWQKIRRDVRSEWSDAVWDLALKLKNSLQIIEALARKRCACKVLAHFSTMKVDYWDVLYRVWKVGPYCKVNSGVTYLPPPLVLQPPTSHFPFIVRWVISTLEAATLLCALLYMLILLPLVSDFFVVCIVQPSCGWLKWAFTQWFLLSENIEKREWTEQNKALHLWIYPCFVERCMYHDGAVLLWVGHTDRLEYHCDHGVQNLYNSIYNQEVERKKKVGLRVLERLNLRLEIFFRMSLSRRTELFVWSRRDAAFTNQSLPDKLSTVSFL